MMAAKRILILLRHGDEHRLSEALDAALVAAVFDQSVTVLFREQAVETLCGARPSERILDIIRTMKDYGVHTLYVCSRSLSEQGLILNLEHATPLAPADQARVIAAHDVVLND